MLWLCEWMLDDLLPWLAAVGGAIIMGLWMTSDNVCTFVGRYTC